MIAIKNNQYDKFAQEWESWFTLFEDSDIE